MRSLLFLILSVLWGAAVAMVRVVDPYPVTKGDNCGYWPVNPGFIASGVGYPGTFRDVTCVNSNMLDMQTTRQQQPSRTMYDQKWQA